VKNEKELVEGKKNLKVFSSLLSDVSLVKIVNMVTVKLRESLEALTTHK
jgi:hypothetical protein